MNIFIRNFPVDIDFEIVDQISNHSLAKFVIKLSFRAVKWNTLLCGVQVSFVFFG